MPDKIFVPAYWPMWKDTNLYRKFTYVDKTGSMPNFISVFSYDKGSDSMLLTDFTAHLDYQDTWFYQYRPGFGIAEYRDDYPGGKKVVMDGMFGTPIGWGEFADIGGSYVNYPKMSPTASWPPAFASGVQCVAFEALLPSLTLDNGKTYDNVLQYSYLQAWDGKAAGGARYWAALGIGPIRLAWMAQDPSNPLGKPLIVTATMDADIEDIGSGPLVS
jgi:hypothetical protein